MGRGVLVMLGVVTAEQAALIQREKVLDEERHRQEVEEAARQKSLRQQEMAYGTPNVIAVSAELICTPVVMSMAKRT